MKFKPYEQGSFSALCGIYSIINSVRIIKGLNNEESKDLFIKIVKYLEESKNIAEALTEGINITVMGSIFKNVIEDNIKRSIPFHKDPIIKIGKFWNEMKKFTDENEAEGQKRVILLALEGKHEHWSVTREITDKRIILFDSVGLKYLDKRNCTTKQTSSSKRHLIQPTQTYFLSN